MTGKMEMHYDEEADYLEVSFGAPPEKEYTEQLDSEVLITRDENTNEVKSIGIVAFKKRAKEEILKRVLKQLGMSIPLDVSVSKA